MLVEMEYEVVWENAKEGSFVFGLDSLLENPFSLCLLESAFCFLRRKQCEVECSPLQHIIQGYLLLRDTLCLEKEN